MAKKETGLVATASEESLALLRSEFPSEPSMSQTLLPRFSMASQDVMEGEGKNKKVVVEAGTFYLESQDEDETEVEDEKGKAVMKRLWTKTEIGDKARAIIVFQRKQLRFYDEDTETYTSSPVYDSEDEIVPLFCEKSEVARGTPKELKEKYQFTDKDGKTKSKLEDNRILYVLYTAKNGEPTVYQLNLRGSSMYSFMSYARELNKKGRAPNMIVTEFGSEHREKGKIEWNMMTFEAIRDIGEDEAKDVLGRINEFKSAIAQQKAFFASKDAADQKANDEFNNFGKK